MSYLVSHVLADREALKETIDLMAEWAGPKKPDIVVGGEALVKATDKVVEKAKRVAALFRGVEQQARQEGGIGVVLRPGLQPEIPLADAAGRPVLIDDLDAVPGFARLLDAVEAELRHGRP